MSARKTCSDRPTDGRACENALLCGLTFREAAECLDISPRTADNYWAYAKAWLLRELEADH